jgi:hypothetical protein
MIRALVLSGYLLNIGIQGACANENLLPGQALDALARSYLQIPYRTDGATDSRGRFVTFGNPIQESPKPGLNCSGFVIDFARKALGKPFPLGAVTYDRENNSGPESRFGEDWDFGRDLILNITEGLPREFIGPIGEAGEDGFPAEGFNLHDKSIWREVVSQLEFGKVYFASISKPWYRKKPYSLIHYHVGVILKDSESRIWLYHSTRLSRVHRYNLASLEGMAQFDFQFAQSRFGDKHILLIGIAP